MKTLIIAIVLFATPVLSQNHDMAMRIASEVAEATQGYIGDTIDTGEAKGIMVVPNEYLDFSMMRSLIGMIHHSYSDMRVKQSWTKDSDGYMYVLVHNRSDFYAIYYTNGVFVVFYTTKPED